MCDGQFQKVRLCSADCGATILWNSGKFTVEGAVSAVFWRRARQYLPHAGVHFQLTGLRLHFYRRRLHHYYIEPSNLTTTVMISNDVPEKLGTDCNLWSVQAHQPMLEICTLINEQIHFGFGQIHFPIWTNAFPNLEFNLWWVWAHQAALEICILINDHD